MASMPEKNINNDHQLNGELYKALWKDEPEKVIRLCERIDDHAFHILTIQNDTVLPKATYAKQANLVLRLLEALPRHHLSKMTHQNKTGNTILHEAATLYQENSVDVAKKMLEKAPELLRMTNKLGETALFRAARYGKTEIFNFLTKKMLEHHDEASCQQPFIQRKDKTTILHIAILAQHFGLALEIPKQFVNIIDEKDEDDMTALQLLSCNPSAFKIVRRDPNSSREFPAQMDIVSLASSLTSVVMFLSILTSPFEQQNFLKSLPQKLIVGFTLLFFSVTTTMLSFTATILLIIRLEKKTWTTTLIYTAAFLPISVFALMQFPLYLAFTTCMHSLVKKIMKKVPRFFKGSAARARSIQT